MRLLKNITYLFAVLAASISFGTVITVDNNAGARTMFSDAQAAIDASSLGDTLLIKGSGATYGDIVLPHRLTIIGESAKTVTGYTNTYIDNVKFASTDCSGSVFKYLYIHLWIDQYSGFTDDVDNLRFESIISGNYAQPIFGANWQIIACSYAGFSITGTYGLRVENSYIGSIDSSTHTDGSSTIKVDNCVLSTPSNSRDVLYTNCIFTTTSTNTGLQFSVYNYCIFTSAISATDLSNAGASSSNCLFGTNPLFVSTIDFQLQGLSPALGTGLNGEDIGLTGGDYPVTNFNCINNLPVVTSAVMKTAVIKPGEGLIFEFSADQKPNLNE